MSEVTELMARSLSVLELADRFIGHSDPAVRVLAEKLIADNYGDDDEDES
jgi:hypothetical protein